MKISIESFQTVDGVLTISVSPSVSRRQKANWYVWIKPDGSALLVSNGRLNVHDSVPTTVQGTRMYLPANSDRGGNE